MEITAEQYAKLSAKLDSALDKCGALERENERLKNPDLLGDIEAQARAWIAVHRAAEDVGLLCFVPPDGFGSGQHRTVEFIKHLGARVATLSRALQTARHALEWIANGASSDPQRYAKSAIADLDQPEPQGSIDVIEGRTKSIQQVRQELKERQQ